MSKKNAWGLTTVAAVLASGSAWATDGYFPHGYGMKALGMGGASVAMTDNAFAGANNPATAAFAGNRAELGVNLFSPKRSAETMGQETQSDSNLFLVPEFGYNKDIDAKTSFGVTVYGNGGMNTDYPVPLLSSPESGATRTGVDLMQLIVAPTLAYKLNEQHSVGVSPLLVYQKFKAKGLEGFGVPSSTGSDSSSGIGVRLGYFGKLSEQVSVGVSHSPKVKMSKFDRYAGLFVNQGEFDIPENSAIGLAIQATPTVKVAADYQRIKYGAVPSIANSSLNVLQCPVLGADPGDPASCPGKSNGPGFGWSNVNVVKLGVEWAYSSTVTLRAGYNKSTNPVHGADVTFNILAPGVITQHYTLGGTYKLSKDSELSWAYMYAPQNSVTGGHLMNPILSEPLTQTIRMSQQSLGIQYGWKF